MAHVHGSRLDVVPKLIYRFNVIPIRVLADVSAEAEKLVLKVLCNSKGSRIAKIILRKKNKGGRVGGLK